METYKIDKVILLKDKPERHYSIPEILVWVFLLSILYNTVMTLCATDSQSIPDYQSPLPESTPEIISTPISTPIATPISTPMPTSPRRYIPPHAKGDRKSCNTCHKYPSFDENDDPYFRADMDYTLPTPTPEPTSVLESIPIITPEEIEYWTDGYYDTRRCYITNVYEYLTLNSWDNANQYELNSWDCSNMAAYTEWELENCGYNTVIRTSRGHAWILVEFTEGWLAYECTGCYWVFPDEQTALSIVPAGSLYYWNPSFYDNNFPTYNNIYEIRSLYPNNKQGSIDFDEEWGWD